MANFVCQKCAQPFRTRGNAPRKYCSRQCFFDAIGPSKFSFAEWYAKNRQDQSAKRLEWARRNPEKRRASRAKWQAANRERLAADAAQRRNDKRASNADMVAIMAAAAGRCTYCGQPSDRLELDHVDPVTRGGIASADNLLPACRSCNASKSNKDAADRIFERFGMEGLARAISMLEQRKLVEAYYRGTKIIEISR